MKKLITEKEKSDYARLKEKFFGEDSEIEKQIPKYLMYEPDHYRHFCPTCRYPVKFGEQRCGNCGQKIRYGSDTE